MQTYAQTDILDAVRGVIGDHRPEACYQCMKCTSGCPAAKVSEYKPHMMVILTKAGLAEEVMKSGIIWACSMCLKCKEYCPQDVAPFDVVTALKNVAISKGYRPPEMLVGMSNNVLDYGCIMDKPMTITTTDFEEVSRKSLGLPDIVHPKDMEQFKKTVARFGFRRLS
ncbi:MAG: 4Fe-4S dicluster domain-containing protein [Nitrososphaerales archaeon]